MKKNCHLWRDLASPGTTGLSTLHPGTAAVGMGSKLFPAQAVKDKDYDGIAKKVSDCTGWTQQARHR